MDPTNLPVQPSRKKRSGGYQPVHRVEVLLWGRMIGAVALDPAYGFYAFRYTDEFRARRVEPSPLAMPVAEPRTFLFTDLPPQTFRRLPAMLNDALPDDFGNALIDRYMADQGVSASDITALDRLAYMGDRAMGALTFRPTRGPRTRKPTALRLSALVVEARKAVRGTLDSDDQTNAALRSIIDVGTSAGGARAKAVIAWNPKSEELRSGQLDAPEGFEHWLLKFDGMGQDRELGSSQDYGRIEYAYHLMAKAAGIQMTNCRLLEETGRAHFMTRRFDRGPNNARYHMQTLCAMAHVDYKKKGTNAYSQLFRAMRTLGLSYEDTEEAFRRMAFNVMSRNCDDHSKNFAFRLREGRSWELAPAYDVTFAHNPQGEWTHQHLMSVNGKFSDIGREDLLAEAARWGIGTANDVLEQVREAIQRWPACAEEACVPHEAAHRIGELHLPTRRR